MVVEDRQGCLLVLLCPTVPLSKTHKLISTLFYWYSLSQTYRCSLCLFSDYHTLLSAQIVIFLRPGLFVLLFFHAGLWEHTGFLRASFCTVNIGLHFTVGVWESLYPCGETLPPPSPWYWLNHHRSWNSWQPAFNWSAMSVPNSHSLLGENLICHF